MQRTLYVATKNPGKIVELEQLLAPLGVCVKLCTDLNPNISWLEDGDSFYANALIKALAVRALAPADAWILADDSGLEVAALGGRPGIHSSRFAGEDADDKANNAHLLEVLTGETNRQARFVCCLVFIDEQGAVHQFNGHVEGIIADALHGENGFGYDGLFYYPEHGKTFAELGASVKNKISHRANALRHFSNFIANRMQ